MSGKILIATNPAGFSRISRAIKSEYSVQGVFTLSNAQNALSNSIFEATILNVKFDGTKMSDLLRWIRFERNFVNMPIICIKPMNTDPELYKNDIHLAKSLVGTSNFVDLDQAQNLPVPDRAILDVLHRNLPLSIMNPAQSNHELCT